MARFRIMVVDDDDDVRFVVSTLLALEFETVQAQNGLDALEKLHRTQPDLLLMDVSMPIMDGISCCHAIKSNDEFNDIPVFFLSALSSPETKEAAVKCGGVGYFEKPFDSSTLIQAIKLYLDNSGIEPRAKNFSTDEISAIDEMPLGSLDDDEDDLDRTATASHHQTSVDDAPILPARKRRVFGKKRQDQEVESKSTPPPGSDDNVELPTPPKPNYGRIAQENAQEAKPSRPAAPAPDPIPDTAKSAPAARQAPPPAPPKPKPLPDGDEPKPEPSGPPKFAKPPAPTPAPAKPAGPSPAQILAQRRLAAIGRKASSGTSRPRVLVIVNHPQELQVYHDALKGVAEFLPLEDPVQAIILIARFQPDIVVMGIHEERYSGLQFAQMMQSNPRLAHIQCLFAKSAYAEPKHIQAASQFSRHAILRPPIEAASVKKSIQSIVDQPDFKVREKSLSYGVYVNEVIRAADSERAKANKEREKEAFFDQNEHLIRFMAKELKDYKEPKGMDELKGIGAKVHQVR